MSKGHPGKSPRYKQKIKTYEMRKPHRDALAVAREIFAEQFPGQKKNTAGITKIKMQLLQKRGADS